MHAGRPSLEDAERMDIYTRRPQMHCMVQRHSPRAHTFSQRTRRPGSSTLAARHHPRYSTEQSEELSSPGVLLGKTTQAAVKNHSSLHSPGQLTAQPPATSFLCLVQHSCPGPHGQGASSPPKPAVLVFSSQSLLLVCSPLLAAGRAVTRHLLGPNLNSGRSFRPVIQYAAIHFSCYLKGGESTDLVHRGVNSNQGSAARS